MALIGSVVLVGSFVLFGSALFGSVLAQAPAPGQASPQPATQVPPQPATQVSPQPGLQAPPQNTPQPPPPLDSGAKARVVESLASQCREKYVEPKMAEKIGSALKAYLKTEKARSITSSPEFSMAVTDMLQGVAHDKHLRVRFDPKGAEVLAKPEPDRDLAPMREQAKRRNFGFHRMEILDGNIGYLDLQGFENPEWGGETAVAAMNWLSNADALIVDLRTNGGGWPEMVQLITTYLFGNEPVHLNSLYFRPKNETSQYWTLPYVPGRRTPDRPVYVLTSARTFSGAEEFAYNLKELKRAVLIGETTGGGANPGDMYALTDGFVAFIPTGKAVNPISNTNWEGVGVEPDIKVPADSALFVAQEKALEQLASKATDEGTKSELTWILDGLRLSRRAYTPDATELAAFTGTYGIRKVRVDGGRLYFQREDRPPFELRPLARDVFSLGDAGDFRIRFVRDKDGRVVSCEGVSPDRVEFSEPRTE